MHPFLHKTKRESYKYIYIFISYTGLTHEEILAQSLLFFIAGYETTASTITFLCYCLATNMAAQRELQREIDRMVKKQVQLR